MLFRSFTIGNLAFERAQLFPLLADNKQGRVVHLSDGCELVASSCSCGATHEEEDEDHNHADDKGVDPHIWMSPRFMLQMVDRVYEELSKTYPQHKEEFQQNDSVLREKVVDLDNLASEKLAGKQGKAFIIYHPALTYFAADYGLEQIAIEQEGKEPSPAVLKEVIDHATNKEINLILIQNQFDVENAQAVAKSTGCSVKTINPLTNNWNEEMTNLIHVLADNL